MSSVCFDVKRGPFIVKEGVKEAAVCAPCILTADGFLRPQKTTTEKVVFVGGSTVLGMGIGGIAGLATTGGNPNGMFTGIFIGGAVGAGLSLGKVAIDELC